MTRTRSPRVPATAASTTAPVSSWLQPKLAIGAPGDRYEQEADQAADRVLQGGSRPELTPLRAPTVQRQDDERKKEEPDPVGEGLAVVGANLGENNPAFGVFTEKLAADFMRQPPELSVGVPVFLGANYAFLWSMAMVNPAMRRNFDDFNLAMLPGIVPQFPVKTFTYRILDGAQTRFEFDFGLDATSLLEAFNDGVLNTHLSSLKLDSSGRLDTAGSGMPSLSALQVKLGLFSDGVNLTGGFRNGISPYPLIEPGGSVMAQAPALPDLQAGRQDVRFTLNLDLVRLYQHFNPGKPNPLGPQIDVAREAQQPAQAPGTRESSPAAAAAVQSTLAESGAPLEPATRQFMESRFGHDFGRVRIHADAQAAAAAQSVGARAYTVGTDLVFNRGQYAPATPAGRHLLAHELAHVVQQADGAHVMQRKLDVEDFDAGSFNLPTLQAYLAKVGPGRIEDKGDSDDKARAIVAQWRKGVMQLDAGQKIALIQEMQSGFTGNDDERAILTLLLNTPESELPRLFAAKGGLDPKNLDSDFHGAEEDALRAFYDKNFIGGRKSALGGSRSMRTARADEPAVTAPAATDIAAQKPEQGPPRKDYVFIMGDVKKDDFYREAFRYFSAHRPQATFVTDKRSLAAVLSHVASQISEPIGNLYLVSHANEDGTLSFALDGDDKDKKLNVTELRKALRPASGASTLTKVGKQIDARTVIRIKGCDIGRTKEMLDLLDEAFGGVGSVTAPTHEQEYGTDPLLGKRADAAFRAEVAAAHPEPPAVDTNLKGAELKAAKAQRAKAMAERKVAIAAELKERAPERKSRVAQAQQYEAFSGPMFQRPGEDLFTAKELLPELERLYGHLSEKQRKALAAKLVAKDTRPESVALKNGTYQQKGQRLYRRVIPQTHWDPQDATGFLALYRSVQGKTGKGFQPGALSSSPSVGKEGQPQRTYRLTGSLPDGGSEVHELKANVVPDDATYLATARATLNNPDRYNWTQERSYNPKTGKTTLKATATRVLAYLHHGELDAAAHQHFNRTEPDADFYAKSTFAPPPAKPKPKP